MNDSKVYIPLIKIYIANFRYIIQFQILSHFCGEGFFVFTRKEKLYNETIIMEKLVGGKDVFS